MLLKLKYLVLLCTLLHCGLCESNETIDECDEFFENENGTFDHQSLVDTKVKFILLTPDGDNVELNSTNLDLVNKTNPTKIMVHGLGNYEDYSWIDKMTRVYHTHGNYNVIAVDWMEVTETDKDYLISTVDEVGNILGVFILEITETDIDYLSSIHMIGSSVGAQISGAAGKTVAKGTNNTKVGRITGLVPTQPEDLGLLDEDGADFVDVIHTSALVDSKMIGTVDFYVVNGDFDSPICLTNDTSSLNSTSSTNDTYIGVDVDSSEEDLCGEVLASDLYTETIDNSGRYLGISCYYGSDSLAKVCDKANSASMGEYVSRNASGKYVVVNSAAPAIQVEGKFVLCYTFVLLLWHTAF